MNEPTLMILAAGMGSRYGGLKQIDPMGHHGEIIMDYSIYDAKRAGFKKVVFLIAPWMREEFDEVIGKRVATQMEVAYAYQEFEKFLPEGFEVPEGRKKPWGTGHAVLCCRDVVDGPFAMINADDYYGPNAFQQIYDELRSVDMDARPMQFSMVGYMLGSTLTDKGKVARGLCQTNNGMLDSIIERTYIVQTPTGPAYSTDGGVTLIDVPAESPVSLNFWGFTPALFDELARRFPLFLENAIKENPNEEIYIPNVIGEMLREGLCTVKVLQSRDKWHGVTYKEDKPDVMAAISSFIEEGLYPENLWGV